MSPEDRGFLSPIEEIVEEARQGRMFILVDDEDRENEGDLVIPAEMATPEAVTEIPGVGEKTAAKIVVQARAYLEGAEVPSAVSETQAGDTQTGDTQTGDNGKGSADGVEEKEVLAMSVAEVAEVEHVEHVDAGPDLGGLDEASGGER